MEAAAVTESEREAGLRVARTQRVAIFVVAYNAEAHIRATLRRIPAELLPLVECIYVIDDRSSDATTTVARELLDEIPQLQVFRTPFNQGYGGNQKLGYRYAVEQDFDVVVLLHGDGQYAPEVLPRLLAPFENPHTMAVFGSRMMVPGAAQRGKMPLYKRAGNRILTALQNSLLGTNFSEFHSGYRAYRVQALAQLPLQHNTSDFHFDTEIIVQLLFKRFRIVEVPIPTYYGDEICHVNGLAYGCHCLVTVLQALANRIHLVYHPKFYAEGDQPRYEFKHAATSLHQYIVRRPFLSGQRIIEIGSGNGEVGRALHERGAELYAVDLNRPDATFPFPYAVHDLDEGFAAPLLSLAEEPVDVVLALDIVEHLRDPEQGVREIKKLLRPGGKLIASTGNIAYVLLRIALLLGQFNYGKKGILDLTHRRLFTIRSFKRLLVGEGLQIDKVRGFGPPILDMVGDSKFWRFVDHIASWAAALWPGLFAYQFVIEATRKEDLEHILSRTLASDPAVEVARQS